MVKVSSKYHPINKRKFTPEYRIVLKTDCAELDRLMEEHFEQFIEGNHTEISYGTGNSDHKMVKFSSKYHPIKRRKFTSKYRTVVKTDCAELDTLMEEQFEQFVDGNDTESAYGDFYSKT